ncbi:MAG: DNA cytosine methyltransferase, partial [Bacteroidaceae bacterium]|nr:DNA cytosine methyltransferase [Bacteroidaceae bacterium]
RERIYMVCFRSDISSFVFHFPQPIRLKKHVEDILLHDEKEVERLYISREDTYMLWHKDDAYRNRPVRLGVVNKGGQGERIYSARGIAITLSANGGGIFARTGGYMVNGHPRRLHPRECARLMGYPDTYQISERPNQAYKQLGNSVVVDVLQYIAVEIGETLSLNNLK